MAAGRSAGLWPALLLLCGIGIVTAEAAPPGSVGYRTITLPDAVTGESFPVALWYPTLAAPAPLYVTGSLSLCRLPAILCRQIAFGMTVAPDGPVAPGTFGVIVVSHGAGGMALLHRDLAVALASRGHVVAAPTHPRGQGDDVTGIPVWVGRPKQVSRVIDAVLEDGQLGTHVDRQRIGAVGHSNGGYTVLAVAGARPSPGAEGAHCREHPDDTTFCGQGNAATRKAVREIGQLPELRDPRVRAIVAMAPNAVRFSDEALAKVTVPVLVYAGEKDDLTRLPYHGERLARTVPRVECVLVEGAGHFSFLAGFPWALRLIAGDGARDPAGFDRDAFHERLNRDIVAFFDRTLRPGGDTFPKGAEPRSCRPRSF